MNAKILSLCLVFGLTAGAAAATATGADIKAKAKEMKEVTGVIEIVKADPAKKEKYDTVLLKDGKVTYKLLPAKDKKLFKGLESLGGKNVLVKGEYMAPKLPKYPLAALKVDSFSVVEKTAPAAAPAPERK